MTEEISGKTIWNEASKAGLVLGGICVVCSLLSSLTGLLGGGTMVKFFMAVIGGVIWLAKFGGCIFAMRFFMLKFVADHPDATNRETRLLGSRSALLSALIVSAYTLATTMLISPEQLQESLNIAMSQYSSMLDSNSMAAVEGMMDRLPVIMFFTNLAYCFIYGCILSAILSRDIPSRNPFDRTNGAF